MNVERVKMLKTLKCGSKIWRAGLILPDGDPSMEKIPPEILTEVRFDTGVVEVLDRKVISNPPPAPPAKPAPPSADEEEPITEHLEDESSEEEPIKEKSSRLIM